MNRPCLLNALIFRYRSYNPKSPITDLSWIHCNRCARLWSWIENFCSPLLATHYTICYCSIWGIKYWYTESKVESESFGMLHSDHTSLLTISPVEIFNIHINQSAPVIGMVKLDGKINLYKLPSVFVFRFLRRTTKIILLNVLIIRLVGHYLKLLIRIDMNRENVHLIRIIHGVMPFMVLCWLACALPVFTSSIHMAQLLLILCRRSCIMAEYNIPNK